MSAVLTVDDSSGVRVAIRIIALSGAGGCHGPVRFRP
jgi:hypothetical protein